MGNCVSSSEDESTSGEPTYRDASTKSIPEQDDKVEIEEEPCDASSGGQYDHQQNSCFAYMPMDSNREVRLLRVMKVTNHSHLRTSQDVEGMFKIVSIKDLPRTNYIALSYFWGRAKAAADVHRIHVGGKDFYIRDNLFNFFMYAGKSCEGKLFYIDAICVNQRDHRERGCQVQRMKTLYGNADCVYAWLGKPLYVQQKRIKALYEALTHARKDHNESISWNREAIAMDRDAMFGFEMLISRPYWKRYWIVQELLLAQHIQVICGKWKFDWDELMRLRNDLNEVQLDPRTRLNWWAVTIFKEPWTSTDGQNAQDHFSGHWPHALRIMTHRSNWQRSKHAKVAPGFALYKAIRYFSDQECCDPKDKVFALLGLLKRSESNKIWPDYSDPVEKVYKDALGTALLCLQEDIEPEALRQGFYPRREYERFSSLLCDVLRLDQGQLYPATQTAFRDTNFSHRFYENYRAQFGSWCATRRKTETEHSIFQTFIMMTEGKIPTEKLLDVAPRYQKNDVSLMWKTLSV